jgi:hypothetical protein
MPKDRPQIKNDSQYEALCDTGMSKSRAARIANAPDSSKHGGQQSERGKTKSSSKQGGTKAQKAAAGRKGGKAAARRSGSKKS